MITYWPPPVCLEGRARRTKPRHVFQTWERKSEMGKASDDDLGFVRFVDAQRKRRKFMKSVKYKTCPLWWFHIIVIQVDTYCNSMLTFQNVKREDLFQPLSIGTHP